MRKWEVTSMLQKEFMIESNSFQSLFYRTNLRWFNRNLKRLFGQKLRMYNKAKRTGKKVHCEYYY